MSIHNANFPQVPAFTAGFGYMRYAGLPQDSSVTIITPAQGDSVSLIEGQGYGAGSAGLINPGKCLVAQSSVEAEAAAAPAGPPAVTSGTFNFNLTVPNASSFVELFALPAEDNQDLFRECPDVKPDRERLALKRVSECCIRELKKRNASYPEGQRMDDGYIERAAAPGHGKFDNFTITDRGLVVYVDFGCTAVGYEAVTIPYCDLADILNPEGALGREAKPVDTKKTPGREEASYMDITDGMIIIDDVRMKIHQDYSCQEMG